MDIIAQLPASFPELYDVSDTIKVVEAAKKYAGPKGEPIDKVPHHTYPGGPNTYWCQEVETSWTQGFFVGLLWDLVERGRLLPATVESNYTEQEIIHLARRYQDGFKFMAKKAINHDQGFRFQLSYGKDYELTGSESARDVMIQAADSLLDRFCPKVGMIRSWDHMQFSGQPDIWRLDNRDEHYLVIIDNMMNLDMLYEVTRLTGDPKYADVANKQAEGSQTTLIRPDGTTYHVVDFNADGSIKRGLTRQGYADESCWSRGQAWAIHGYAQCAARTGRKDFLDTARKVTDKFLELLPESGVPWWDFDAPKPCPYDASAGTIAAAGMLILFKVLRPIDPVAADNYLRRAFKLVEDTLGQCKTGKATLDGGNVNWGHGGWETILKHSTLNGNQFAMPAPRMDHGLVYADYYLLQFAIEAFKLKPRPN